MGVSATATVMFGVEADINHFTEPVEKVEKNICHPEVYDEGDKHCSECGSKIEQTTSELAVNPEYEVILPAIRHNYYLEDLDSWFNYGVWPGEVALKVAYCGSSMAGEMITVVGVSVACIECIMRGGDISKPKSFDADAEKIEKARDLFMELGFSEDDLRFHLCVSAG